MKRLKYFLMIFCMSTTLVVLLNLLLSYLGVASLVLNQANVSYIYMICFIIAVLCIACDCIGTVQDYPMIYSYVIVVSVANGLIYFIEREFYWGDFFIETLFLTVVYLGVWFLLYLDDDKKVKKLNLKIKERNHKG